MSGDVHLRAAVLATIRRALTAEKELRLKKQELTEARIALLIWVFAWTLLDMELWRSYGN